MYPTCFACACFILSYSHNVKGMHTYTHTTIHTHRHTKTQTQRHAQHQSKTRPTYHVDHTSTHTHTHTTVSYKRTRTDTHTNTHTHSHTITRYASVCDDGLRSCARALYPQVSEILSPTLFVSSTRATRLLLRLLLLLLLRKNKCSSFVWNSQGVTFYSHRSE